ncbi:hypothetical protein HBA54_23455 [Pelagibius litoralis]|uniref:Lipoprotein n=1 Tax=Pelagibius litoralis TaxID=374515 RepID=A0A967F223_9PROT|nr:hypothetical protein [Pelagibius litoralis]NIA71552.1 hypothetical protein [Pelagibius litoralis]
MRARSRSFPRPVTAVLLGVLILGLSGCSNQQISRALGGFCHSTDNCTAYNSDGTAVTGAYYNPY